MPGFLAALDLEVHRRRASPGLPGTPGRRVPARRSPTRQRCAPHGPNSPAALPLLGAADSAPLGDGAGGGGGGGVYSTAPAEVSGAGVDGDGSRFGVRLAPFRSGLRVGHRFGFGRLRLRFDGFGSGVLERGLRDVLDGGSLRLVGIDQRRRGYAHGHAGGGAPGGTGADRQQFRQRRHSRAPGPSRRGDLRDRRVATTPAAEREPGLDRGGQVVQPVEDAAVREHGRQSSRRPRGRPVGAHRRPAAGAGAEVLADGDGVLGARLAIAECGEERAQFRAAAAVLAAGDDAAKPLPPLGQAAIDFGLAEAGDLADLGVGVTLREQRQRPQLRRLQRPQRLAAAGDQLAALGQPVGAVAGGRDHRHPVLAGRVLGGLRHAAQQSLALAPDRERLVLDHGVGPPDQLVHPVVGRFRQQDLERSLVGVLGILRVQRVAAGGPAQGGAVLRDQLDGGALARRLIDAHRVRRLDPNRVLLHGDTHLSLHLPVHRDGFIFRRPSCKLEDAVFLPPNGTDSPRKSRKLQQMIGEAGRLAAL